MSPACQISSTGCRKSCNTRSNVPCVSDMTPIFIIASFVCPGTNIRISREKKASSLAFFPRRSIFGGAKLRKDERKSKLACIFSEAEYVRQDFSGIGRISPVKNAAHLPRRESASQNGSRRRAVTRRRRAGMRPCKVRKWGKSSLRESVSYTHLRAHET